MKRIRRQSEKEKDQKNDSKLMKLSVKEKEREKIAFRGPGAALLPSVALSEYDKASQLTLSKDQLTIHGCEGGYRMVRATHGLHWGSYYWELEVLAPSSDNSHVRVGWSTRQGELQAPVGFDQCSFGYRNINGSKVHKSLRVDNYGESFGVGDIIGCYIHLGDEQSATSNRISFFKNGIDQGIAFCGNEIPSGVYFPAVSLYMKANVRVNFGPSFILRPTTLPATVNAVSELQPMSYEDRKVHEQNIQAIRQGRKEQAEIKSADGQQ